MRLLGLDIGERRVGVAVSDPDGRVATPVKVVAAPLSADPRTIKRLIEDYEVEAIVVGLPLSMDGTEGPQAAAVRAEGERIAALTGLPVSFADERLSSVAAERAMAASGLDSKARRGSVDMVAASILLQTHLDAMRSGGCES